MTTDNYYERVAEAAAYLRARVPKLPEIAVVLGSGVALPEGRVNGALRGGEARISRASARQQGGRIGTVVASFGRRAIT